MATIQSRFDRRWGVLLAGFALVAAACSSSAGGSAAPESAAATAAAAASAPASQSDDGYSKGGGASAAASEAAGGGSAYEVDVASGAAGKFLTGEDGKTLYIFKKDSPNTSACTGDCATNWPPFTLEADETLKAGTGVGGALTTFARADGTMQVAYNGAPLYYFAADKAAGDTNGQGLNNVWFVAAP